MFFAVVPASLQSKRAFAVRGNSTWYQTDLDTLSSEDIAASFRAGARRYQLNQQSGELSDPDERMKRFYGLAQQREKSLEIKTVR